jgi:hypothetical protein
LSSNKAIAEIALPIPQEHTQTLACCRALSGKIKVIAGGIHKLKDGVIKIPDGDLKGNIRAADSAVSQMLNRSC